ncbi:hypothetical protein Prudu_016537 [Prunus dulcis]|uniref:Uncharacterized protein n=1 Tax=Prunus dulcis TaxID=3755 RepID=A0A4Y1RNE9_PRUDU|nr:hypothetical protein Prudu_016537 [Prunus dulcis]
MRPNVPTIKIILHQAREFPATNIPSMLKKFAGMPSGSGTLRLPIANTLFWISNAETGLLRFFFVEYEENHIQYSNWPYKCGNAQQVTEKEKEKQDYNAWSVEESRILLQLMVWCDLTKKKFTAPEEVWADYFKSYPSHTSLQTKTCEDYEDL